MRFQCWCLRESWLRIALRLHAPCHLRISSLVHCVSFQILAAPLRCTSTYPGNYKISVHHTMPASLGLRRLPYQNVLIAEDPFQWLSLSIVSDLNTCAVRLVRLTAHSVPSSCVRTLACCDLKGPLLLQAVLFPHVSASTLPFYRCPTIRSTTSVLKTLEER